MQFVSARYVSPSPNLFASNCQAMATFVSGERALSPQNVGLADRKVVLEIS